MSTTSSLFVYGSFTSGMIHRAHLESYIESSTPGFAKGFCYLMPVGYPAFLEEPVSHQGELTPASIPGELVRITAPDLVFKLMDEFHGVSPLVPERGLHFKKEIQIQVDGESQLAWSYLMNPLKVPKESRLIENGDWQSAVSDQSRLGDQLSSKQIEYLRRLASAKGRSLVPYDLNMSRELMKMGLIVDKGRRLAPSKLGKDLLRYLP